MHLFFPRSFPIEERYGRNQTRAKVSDANPTSGHLELHRSRQQQINNKRFNIHEPHEIRTQNGPKTDTRAPRSLFAFEAFRAASGASEEATDERCFQKLGFSCSRQINDVFRRSFSIKFGPESLNFFGAKFSMSSK